MTSNSLSKDVPRPEDHARQTIYELYKSYEHFFLPFIHFQIKCGIKNHEDEAFELLFSHVALQLFSEPDQAVDVLKVRVCSPFMLQKMRASWAWRTMEMRGTNPSMIKWRGVRKLAKTLMLWALESVSTHGLLLAGLIPQLVQRRRPWVPIPSWYPVLLSSPFSSFSFSSLRTYWSTSGSYGPHLDTWLRP